MVTESQNGKELILLKEMCQCPIPTTEFHNPKESERSSLSCKQNQWPCNTKAMHSSIFIPLGDPGNYRLHFSVSPKIRHLSNLKPVLPWTQLKLSYLFKITLICTSTRFESARVCVLYTCECVCVCRYVQCVCVCAFICMLYIFECLCSQVCAWPCVCIHVESRH